MKITKGMKDSLPSEQLIRNQIMGVLRTEFERFGFRPLDTPAIENEDVLAAKYAAGDEILEEMFTLLDRGKRKLGLRYDLTVPLARFIAINPQLKFPFKRYQMSKVWRDGPIGLGRYREFWQCDVDTVGSASMNADAEILAIAQSVFKVLGLKVQIRVNNRKLMNGILEKLKIADKISAILVIDKLDKLNRDELLQEFKNKGIPSITAYSILDFFSSIPKGNSQILKFLKQELTSNEAKQGIKETEELLQYLQAYAVNVNLAPELARGLAYYTSTVFETFIPGSKVSSSVAGGGRYDNMIGNFIGNKQSYPAVGISFGVDRIFDALVLGKQVTQNETMTRVFIVPIGTELEAIKLTQSLRAAGIDAETDISGKGISKNLNYANSLGIPFVVFLGQQELKSKKFKIRDMNSGKESMKTFNSLVKMFQ